MKLVCNTLLLHRALKQRDRRKNVITKSIKCSLFSIQGNFLMNRKDFPALTLVRPNSENLVLYP